MGSEAVTYYGAKSEGHDCWPSRQNDQGSPDVFVAGIPVHRKGDHWLTHCCDSDCHDGSLKEGSSTVFVNGKACGRKGDPIDCGDTVKEGITTVQCAD